MRIIHIDVEPKNNEWFILACGLKRKVTGDVSLFEQNVVLVTTLDFYPMTSRTRYCEKCLSSSKLALHQLATANL